METENAPDMLARRVEILCARCEALGREIRTLRGENRRLRQKCETAKEKIRGIIARIPEINGADAEQNQ
ncbi:MAG: hypothetical protein HAW59_01150 [Betaproteobacteria bacterium]|nr:hypothetical protein [Betaproteobacteria bacterium]